MPSRRQPRRISFVIFLLLLGGLGLDGSTARAQIDQGGISGAVKDAGGALVPHAAVVITDTATGLQFHTASDAAGEYTFQPLKVGTYRVQATAPGFDSFTINGVQVDANQTVRADITLKTGGAQDYVVVNANERPLLQTEDASLGMTFTGKEVSELPVPDRDYVFLAQLAPGVVPAETSGGSGTGAFSANGMRSQQNNFLLDGVDNNSPAVDNITGANYEILPAPEGISQVRVQTGNYSAELGRSGGAVLNVVTKSGTNRWQGEAWGFFRNDALDAHSDFEANGKAPYHDIDVGLAVGGHITSKLFVFADTRQWRIYAGSTPTPFTVPTLKERAGDFSEYAGATINGSTFGSVVAYEPPNPAMGRPGAGLIPLSCNGVPNVLCASQIDPIAQNLLNLFPKPNIPGVSVGQPNYQTEIVQANQTNSNSIRFDWDPTSRDQAYFRYGYTRNTGNYTPPFGPVLDGDVTNGSFDTMGMGFVLSETHVFTSRLVNEFRIGYNYGTERALQRNFNTREDSQFGLGGIPYLTGPDTGGLPVFAVSGISQFGTPKNRPQFEGQNAPQILDNLSFTLRNHSLRAGFAVQQNRFFESVGQYPRGLYTYTGQYTSQPGSANGGIGVIDFLTNNMYSANNSVGINNTIPTGHDQRWSNAVYLEDDWRATSTITVNLGIRWDYFAPATERNGHQALFTQLSPSRPNSIYGTGSGSYLFPSSMRNTPISSLLGPYESTFAKDNIAVGFSDNESGVTAQKTNISPRIGVAWQMRPDLVVRAGYGLFYGGLESIGFKGNLSQNYPFLSELQYQSAACSKTSCPNVGISLESGFAGSTSQPVLSLRGSQSQTQTTEAQTFNLSLQQAIKQKMTFQIGYVGSLGRHLQVLAGNSNNPAALYASSGTTAAAWRTFPDFGSGLTVTDDGISDYNSLQTTFVMRPIGGFMFTANYTWSHSLDDAIQAQEADSSTNFYRGPDIFGIGPDYSNSAFDIRHRLTALGSYQLPFGTGRRWLNHHGWKDVAFGRWNINPILRMQTGRPMRVNGDSTHANGGDAYAVVMRNPFAPGGSPDPSNKGITCPSQVRTKAHWYNPCAFANPASSTSVPAGTYVTGLKALSLLGGKEYTVYGPGYFKLDASIAKTFTFTDHYSLQFRGDCYNTTNTPAWGQPDGSILTGVGGVGGGEIQTARVGPAFQPDGRAWQLAAKLYF